MARIQGRVIDASGAGVANALVKFIRTDKPGGESVLTKGKGTYVTTPLKAGPYRWEVTCDGFTSAAGDLPKVPTQGTITQPDVVLERSGSISGAVVDEKGVGAVGVPVLAVQSDLHLPRTAFTDAAGLYVLRDLVAGPYRLTAQGPPGFVQPPAQSAKVAPGQDVVKLDFQLSPEVATPAPTTPTTPTPPSAPTPPQNVPPAPTTPTQPSSPVTGPTGPAGPTGPGSTPPISTPSPPGADPVALFFAQLDGGDFSLFAKVSEPEAEQAITIFSVVNMLIAGKSERVVGGQRKVDVLGILALYYGLQDRSLAIPVRSQQLFAQIDGELKSLRDALDTLGADVNVVEREAKRQFNLGRSTDVAGNADFPRLFRRYVELASDPLLFLNLRVETDSGFSDKEKLAKAFDLLRELKDAIVGLIRSLSRSGTIATTRLNRDWTDYMGRAMAVLRAVADERLAEDDSDEKRPLAVLAALTAKDLDTQIVPYVAAARDGGTLLDLALEAYRATKEELENYDEQHLLDLFQQQNAVFLTTRLRASAATLRDQVPRLWV